MTTRGHHFSAPRWLLALGVLLLIAGHAAFIALTWRTYGYIALGAIGVAVVALKFMAWKRHR